MNRSAAAACVLLALSSSTSVRAGDDAPNAPPGRPLQVVVGAYVDRITEMSLRENHFHADFYLWFRRSGGDEEKSKRLDRFAFWGFGAVYVAGTAVAVLVS